MHTPCRGSISDVAHRGGLEDAILQVFLYLHRKLLAEPSTFHLP